MSNFTVPDITKRDGKRIECSACWAHPRTPRLCYCDEPSPPREQPAIARVKGTAP